MNQYESILIFAPDCSKEERAKKIESLKTIIEENGKFLGIEELGDKHLLYQIKHKKRGYYILIKFNIDRSKNLIPQLNTMLKLSNEVLRHSIVRIDG